MTKPLSSAALSKAIRSGINLAAKHESMSAESAMGHILHRIDESESLDWTTGERSDRSAVRIYLKKSLSYIRKFGVVNEITALDSLNKFREAHRAGQFDVMTAEEHVRAREARKAERLSKPVETSDELLPPEPTKVPQIAAQGLSVPFLSPEGVINTDPVEEW